MKKVFAAIIVIALPACDYPMQQCPKQNCSMQRNTDLGQIDYLQDKIHEIEARKPFDCATASGDILYPPHDDFKVTGTLGAETK